MLLQPIIGKVLRKTTTLYMEIFKSELICKNYNQKIFEHICSSCKLKLLLPRGHDCCPGEKIFKLFLGAT
jgi:hypothetical protein